MKRVNLVGKSRGEIEHATRDKSRPELVNLLYELASVEPMFTPQQIAELRHLSKDTVLDLIRRGRIRAHKPLENGLRIPLSAVQDWDAATALFFDCEPNGTQNEDSN